MIRAAESKLHWNYYLALERDMEQLSRYVEFCEPNLSVYSIEGYAMTQKTKRLPLLIAYPFA
jgi:hypothetical protein